VPIVVVPLVEEEGRYQVIDGYSRVRLLKKLGADTVRATVWDLSESEALLLDRSLRTAERETAIEQGWLLQVLRNLPLSYEEMASRFDRSVSWVSQRLSLVDDLPRRVQELIRAGRIPAQAAMKYLVPMARGSREDCEAFALSVAEHHFTSREIGDLYKAWRDGSGDVRHRVLESPELFLRVQRELEEASPPQPPAREVIRDLELAGRLLRRAERKWKDAALAMSEKEREEVLRCLDQALVDLDRLSRRIHSEEEGHAEPGHADGDPDAFSEGCGHARDREDATGLAPGGPAGDPVGIGGASPLQAKGESRATPARDPGALRLLPGEPGPGP
jgi:ParB/RepB/Spo0J family partition protein